MTFVELVEVVSDRTGQTKKVVSSVLRVLPEEVLKALEDGERVKFPSFGAFFTKVVQGRRVVRFKRSRRKSMEKLGVVIDDDKTKTASVKGTCPSCGAYLVSDLPPQCSRCGTEPFEKRPNDK